ncbi:FecR domain-containing protein [Bacterioplanoides sp. SCSIO 12839]|uniref:FecR domain-containing protein n=1 Tax=Bacterioplanoides sp. SCSIO 12839 TaxID=2829569 RepID=UPI0021082D5B|nr:FecR domain-containing protein [Bacterioplanoides sp. SCSIO 12839]UTW48253.1 FecR domain-containing protein [Bacterioplanoides sp. SCSIO 12839]
MVNETQATAVQAVPESVVRQAIAWRIRLGSDDVDESDVLACDHWRRSDTTHELAWQRLDHMEAPLKQVKAPGLTKTLMQTDADCRRLSRRQALRNLGGGVLSVVALGLMAQHQGVWQRLRADFSSGAERSQFTLSDRSELWLNNHSAVELDFNDKHRQIRLTRGEMHLVSAIDPRPLEIELPQAVLQAQHGQFTVRRDAEHSLLQVNQGQVAMHHKYTGQSTHIQAGQVMRLFEHNVEAVDAGRFDYGAWVNGVLAVRDMPLSELLGELARYRNGYLRCDPALADFLVSGVYQLRDTDLVLQTLARSAAAEVTYLTPWWVNITPRQVS